VKALVALGSNLGDRGATLRRALAELGRLDSTRLLAASTLHETTLRPRALLDALLSIEHAHGRTRAGGRAARTLDLDLILHGAARLDEPGLTLPHPRFRARAFVLAPAAEVAPNLVDPVTQRTIAELAHALLSAPQ
jgi:2-amino-4-hydroxy-6-hydroxymethyldihydropteridine diphosphokinase